MKKAVIFLMILPMALFCACARTSKADICIFTEEFNKVSGMDEITLEEIYSSDTKDGTKYEVFIDSGEFSEKLITLYTDEALNIKEIHLTASAPVSKKEKNRVFDIFKIITAVYSQNAEDGNEIITALYKKDADFKSGTYSKYYDTHRYSYNLSINNAGMDISIKSILLSESTGEALTLR